MRADGAEQFQGTERFEILRRLGAGGMGVVYEALDRERGNRVALKALPCIDPSLLYHLKQEFRSLADVTHPNLVALHELFSAGGQWFFTMELIDGVNFLDHVRHGSPADYLGSFGDTPPLTGSGARPPSPSAATVAAATEVSAEAATVIHAAPATAVPPGPVPPPGPPGPLAVPAQFARLRAALRQLVEGVAALHAAGKLHRDIKPSNVLVTHAGRVVLLDFGLVTELAEQRGGEGVAGTVAYMSPEQAAGRPLTPASDWYAVGVMLYEALTGRLPFEGRRRDILAHKQERDPLPPAALAPAVPDDLNELCLALLSRCPDDRPSDADLLRRLEAPFPGPHLAGPQRLPFVGREKHLALLNDAYRTVRRGRTVAVFVHGRSGAGKSYLVQRFLDALAAGGEAVVLAGRCYEQESVPYKALDNLIDALTHHLARLPWEEAEALLPDDTPALARLFPVLRRVGAVAALPPPSGVPDQQELRRRAFAALRQLLARLGRARPLILHIDDLQWGDADSAALLADLLRPPDPPVLLLICSYRSEHAETNPCLRALRGASGPGGEWADRRELEVESLTLEEARRLALQLLGREGPQAEADADAIARESQGNPYFVQELVQSLQQGLDTAGPPPCGVTLDEVLWRRASSLPEASRRLLEVLTVAGRPLAQADAYRAADLRFDDRLALTVLRAGHLVRSTGPGEHDTVEAYHDRIRETVVAHLPPAALRACHRRLALTLEASAHADPEALAVHFEGAGENATAGRYYADAGRKAAEALAFDRAAELYRRALQLRPAEGEEARLLHARLGDALANAGRGAEAARAYEAAARGAGTEPALDLCQRAAYQYCVSGHLDEGWAALRAVLAQVGMRLPGSPFRTLLALLAGRLRLWLRGLHFEERDAAAVPPAELQRIDVTWSASAGLSMFDVLGGANFQTRNLLLALRAGEPYRLARALAWEAAHTSNAGRPARRRTEELLHAARTLAEKINHPHALALVTLSAGIAEFTVGRWRPACTLLEKAEGLLRERCTGVAWELGTAHTFTLWSLFYAGELAEMGRRCGALLRQARQRGDLYETASLGSFVGPVVRLLDDDPAGAREVLEASVEGWSPHGFHLQHVTGLMARTYIDLYAGDAESAWQRWRERWPEVRRSHFLRVQVLRVFLAELHARTALAAAAQSLQAGPLLRTAEREAARIERERLPWAVPLARLVRAGVAALRGDRCAAGRLLAEAAAGFEAGEMRLFAAAARQRQGEAAGDAALAASADEWLGGQQVRQPARLAAAIAPVGVGP